MCGILNFLSLLCKYFWSLSIFCGCTFFGERRDRRAGGGMYFTGAGESIRLRVQDGRVAARCGVVRCGVRGQHSICFEGRSGVLCQLSSGGAASVAGSSERDCAGRGRHGLLRCRSAAVFRAMPAGDKAACAFGTSLGFEPPVFSVLFKFFGVSGCFSLKSTLNEERGDAPHMRNGGRGAPRIS